MCFDPLQLHAHSQGANTFILLGFFLIHLNASVRGANNFSVLFKFKKKYINTLGHKVLLNA